MPITGSSYSVSQISAIGDRVGATASRDNLARSEREFPYRDASPRNAQKPHITLRTAIMSVEYKIYIEEAEQIIEIYHYEIYPQDLETAIAPRKGKL